MKKKVIHMADKRGDLSQKVLNKISAEKIKPKSKTFFIFLSLIMVIGTISFIITASFFINLMIFKVRHYAQVNCQCLQAAINESLIKDTPWVAIIITIISLIGGWVLLKKIDGAYKIERRFILFIILGITIILAITIDASGFNDRYHSRMPGIYCSTGKNFCKMTEKCQLKK